MDKVSCEDALDRLPEWAAGELDGAAADAVAAHVAACARCAAEADVLRMLRVSRPSVPSDLASRIVHAARAGGGSAAPTRTLRRIAPAWALSAAAVLALAVGATVLRSRTEPAQPELGEVALQEDVGVWIADDAVVAGAPVLDELSDDDLAALLEEMGG
jgi:hypothetical protein